MRGLDMLRCVQRAHYVEGRRIADSAELRAMALEIGLDAAAFDAAWSSLEGAPTEAHLRASRSWLSRVGGQGLPTLALEQPDGSVQRFELGPWLGRPKGFLAALGEAMPMVAEGGALQCGPDGCVL